MAIWSRRPDRNAEAVEQLLALGAEAAGFECDVTDEDQTAASMQSTLERFGRIDSLVANAGTSSRQAFTDMTIEQWRHLLQVNLEGAFISLREAARVLVHRVRVAPWLECHPRLPSTVHPARSTMRPVRQQY